ncbi:hypothetical protein E8E12_002050 [Didymella heteroderae]|uniref:Vacuolar protein sorting-associated protein 62 n=1 Tax=Didymella heteroderae TaxID=1769908 RepID=A0A9P5BYC7_9PLEO|nr:hypothetical protein E8E12_002050 [Didymella heteroderae]
MKALPDKYRFAEDHAPIFHLHPEDQYRPSDLTEFLRHTTPMIDRVPASNNDDAMDLDNLSRLNTLGNSQGRNVYLTSRDDVTSNPQWLKGADIDAREGFKGGELCTGAIVVVDKGEGVVDVFYFIFWAYNYGGIVLSQNLGNHVGDWEHVMIRFKGGKPKQVWLSQHSNGEAYTFDALEKGILYVAKGSHAIYAREGDIDHTIPNFNTDLPFLLVDQCKAGPEFDPLLTSYLYSYDRTNRQFTGLNRSSLATGWLLFNGHWGDQEYPADDKRQQSFVGFLKYGDGPTGPADKQLDRKRVWPDNSHAWGQLVRTSLDGRTRLRDQLKEWWWRAFGRKEKAMKIKGEPSRAYADGTRAPLKRT